MPTSTAKLNGHAPLVAKITEAVLKLSAEQAEFLAGRLRLLDSGSTTFGEWRVETDKMIVARGWGPLTQGNE